MTARVRGTAPVITAHAERRWAERGPRNTPLLTAWDAAAWCGLVTKRWHRRQRVWYGYAWEGWVFVVRPGQHGGTVVSVWPEAYWENAQRREVAE
jgi:hypothetical protein